jgi:hypothetical protein
MISCHRLEQGRAKRDKWNSATADVIILVPSSFTEWSKINKFQTIYAYM